MGENHSEKHKSGGDLIKSAVYGGLDGILAAFSIVSGSTGAGLSPIVTLTVGLADVFGEALSMAFGDYLSTKAEDQF